MNDLRFVKRVEEVEPGIMGHKTVLQQLVKKIEFDDETPARIVKQGFEWVDVPCVDLTEEKDPYEKQTTT